MVRNHSVVKSTTYTFAHKRSQNSSCDHSAMEDGVGGVRTYRFRIEFARPHEYANLRFPSSTRKMQHSGGRFQKASFSGTENAVLVWTGTKKGENVSFFETMCVDGVYASFVRPHYLLLKRK